ncbi:MAG: alternative ribosome rescue aminoacyl-tRNA hydrolase ArfB [Algisphaera sp.]
MPCVPDSTPTPDEPSDALTVAPGRSLPSAALRFVFSRASGPGGQNVNKVNTRATLTVAFDDLARVLPWHAMDRLRTVASRYHAMNPDRLVIHAGDSRSQLANRRACLDRLRQVLLLALHRPPVRRKTRPSRGAVQRRLTAKKQRGETKRGRRRPDMNG